MKRLFVVLFAFALLSIGFAQNTAQIGDIKGFKNRAIRTAFENIGSQTKTVSGVWTFSATPVFSGGQTVTGILTADTTIVLQNGEKLYNSTDGDVVFEFDDDAATLGEIVYYCGLDDSVFADNDLWNIHFRSLDEDSTALNNWVTLESKILDATGSSKDSHFAVKTYAANTQVTGLTVSGGNLTLNNGAVFSNPHADTLKITEAVTKVNKLALSAAPTLAIEAITLHAGATNAERVLLTIGGVDYVLVAAADSADYAN